MSAGVWKMNGDTIRFNGNGDLIDGQHRLNACVQAAQPFDTYVVRGLEHDSFDTIDQGKKRTIGDVLARQGHKHYTALASSLRWLWMYQKGFGKAGNHGEQRPDEAMAILERNPGLHDAVDFASQLRRHKKLIHPGLLGFLVYETSRKDKDKAEAFWTQVINAEGLKKGSPAYMLHSRLVDNLGSVAKLHAETIAALSIKAWNLHQSGKSCGVLKIGDGEEIQKIQ